MARYPITEFQKTGFRRDGHILLTSVADANEIGRYRNAVRDAVLSHACEKPPLAERDTYGRSFLQITNLWRQDEIVKEFVFDPRYAQIAADLLGVERVRLYHDQALFKEPNGGNTPWHQDKFYWPLDTDKMITMWMPLVDVDSKMGLMRFASGSHNKGGVENIGISDKSEAVFARYVEAMGFTADGPEKMSAGDATFHSGWTLHAAGENRSDRMREIMTIIYFEDGAHIVEPENAFQQADLEAWFPGLGPGDVAASPLTPVLN